MSKKSKKSCCCSPCCGYGRNINGDPGDPSNFAADPRSFCALQNNQQMFFWLLFYMMYMNNTMNCNILCKHDKLENYLICSHEKLLNNAINN